MALKTDPEEKFKAVKVRKDLQRVNKMWTLYMHDPVKEDYLTYQYNSLYLQVAFN